MSPACRKGTRAGELRAANRPKSGVRRLAGGARVAVVCAFAALGNKLNYPWGVRGRVATSWGHPRVFVWQRLGEGRCEVGLARGSPWEWIAAALGTSARHPCGPSLTEPCPPALRLMRAWLVAKQKPWLTDPINVCQESCKCIAVSSSGDAAASSAPRLSSPPWPAIFPNVSRCMVTGVKSCPHGDSNNTSL